MRARIHIAVLLMLLGITPAMSPAAKGNNPGDFSLALAVTDSASIYKWMATPFSVPAVIHRIQELSPGRDVWVVAIVTGQAIGTDGRCDVDVALKIRRPDGSVWHSEDHFASVHRPMPRGSQGFVLADPALTFGVDRDDPSRPWRFEATAHDRVSGKLTEAKTSVLAKTGIAAPAGTRSADR
jgi:hypothetical protein